MDKIFILLIIFIINQNIFSIDFNKLNPGNLDKIRKPAVSGSFYPADKTGLKDLISKLLNSASSTELSSDKTIGFIIPHAGYIYSGSCAAYAYNKIAKIKPKTIILIGPSHYVYFKGISIYNKGFWETPLGLIKINSDLADKIISCNTVIKPYKEAHIKEHSLEVHLPFLQSVLPYMSNTAKKSLSISLPNSYSDIDISDFEIVPIVMGEQNYEYCNILADAILKSLKNKNTIIIASSDLSHYYDIETAKKMDTELVERLKKFDPVFLSSGFEEKIIEACGQGPILSLILYSQKTGNPVFNLLKLTNSGEISGDFSRGVVGYLSGEVILEKPSSEKLPKKEEDSKMLTNENKKFLLNLARQTIVTYLTEHKKINPEIKDPVLKEINGAFVTLHFKNELRGCIGNIVGYKPLWETVRDMAIEASIRDPRFLPVTIDEMKYIEIEISVLTPLKKVNSADEIILGKHGVVVKKGFNSGVFLPQVATETGWCKEDFLSHLCQDKAGLSPDAWKDKTSDIFIFSAEVFGESDFKKK